MRAGSEVCLSSLQRVSLPLAESFLCSNLFRPVVCRPQCLAQQSKRQSPADQSLRLPRERLTSSLWASSLCYLCGKRVQEAGQAAGAVWPHGRSLLLQESAKPCSKGSRKMRVMSQLVRERGKVKMERSIPASTFYSFLNSYAVFSLSYSSAVWPEAIFCKAVPYQCASVIIPPLSTINDSLLS